MAQNSSNKKIANGLVAVSSAAVMAVYAAGYTRTQSAADKFEAQSAARRPGSPRAVPGRSAAPESRVAGREAAQNAVSPASETAPSRALPASPDPGRDEAGKNNLIASVAPLPVMSTAPVASATNVNAGGGPAAAPVATSSVAPQSNQAVEPAAAPVVEHKAEAAPAAPVQAAVKSIAAPAPAQPVNPTVPPWKDGTYLGWGTCRHGDLQAAVVIQGGKILSAKVSECDTRYSCDVIDVLPPQVAQRQSPEVDNVSGATQSADAFYGAVYNALLQAK
jgi:uncharacterized protein with FMN-binding domain